MIDDQVSFRLAYIELTHGDFVIFSMTIMNFRALRVRDKSLNDAYYASFTTCQM